MGIVKNLVDRIRRDVMVADLNANLVNVHLFSRFKIEND